MASTDNDACSVVAWVTEDSNVALLLLWLDLEPGSVDRREMECEAIFDGLQRLMAEYQALRLALYNGRLFGSCSHYQQPRYAGHIPCNDFFFDCLAARSRKKVAQNLRYLHPGNLDLTNKLDPASPYSLRTPQVAHAELWQGLLLV